MLTSSYNTITLPAGYYESVNVTTSITSLPGEISYLHHQCSNTEAGLTYTDTIVGTSSAASVEETTKNGKAVSTIQGGCFTTPYYYYSVTTTSTVGMTVTGYGYAGNGRITQINWIRDDGVPQYQGVSMFESEAPAVGSRGSTTFTGTAYKYDTSVPSNGKLISTYYLKTCGHTNGELLSATITY